MTDILNDGGVLARRGGTPVDAARDVLGKTARSILERLRAAQMARRARSSVTRLSDRALMDIGFDPVQIHGHDQRNAMNPHWVAFLYTRG